MKICLSCFQPVNSGRLCEKCIKKRKEESIERISRRVFWLIVVLMTILITREETVTRFREIANRTKDILIKTKHFPQELETGLEHKDGFVFSPNYIKGFGEEEELKGNVTIENLADSLRETN